MLNPCVAYDSPIATIHGVCLCVVDKETLIVEWLIYTGVVASGVMYEVMNVGGGGGGEVCRGAVLQLKFNLFNHVVKNHFCIGEIRSKLLCESPPTPNPLLITGNWFPLLITVN